MPAGLSGAIHVGEELWRRESPRRWVGDPLAKQISFLRARCEREEGFRKGLVWTKRWFLMQVEMYNRW